MARAILQSRILQGFGALTTTTQAETLTPANVPDGATITRARGRIVFEYMPASGSADRALIVMGLAVVDPAEILDVALPNSHPDIWLGWWYQPLLLGHGGSAGTTQLPTDLNLDYDVHGQRVLTPTSGPTLRAFARLVGAVGAGTVSIRFSVIQFYKLPEQ